MVDNWLLRRKCVASVTWLTALFSVPSSSSSSSSDNGARSRQGLEATKTTNPKNFSSSRERTHTFKSPPECAARAPGLHKKRDTIVFISLFNFFDITKREYNNNIHLPSDTHARTGAAASRLPRVAMLVSFTRVQI